MEIDNIDEYCMNRITIDIDNYRELSASLLYAVKEFGRENIKLYRSASGTGFRLEIKGKFTPLQNIYYRVILNDDPYRLRYALYRYLSTGNPELLDISFFEKEQIGGYHGRVLEININDIIDDILYEYIKNNDITPDHVKLVMDRIFTYVDKIMLWTIVIPLKEEYIKKIKENFRRYKLLRDPYYDDRIIFYKVSRDNLVKKFEDLDIPIITYKSKEVSTKNIDLSEEY
ncbi:MAG: hypothetical protein ACP5GJ_02675 [Nanopusillaceae archaeon]